MRDTSSSSRTIFNVPAASGTASITLGPTSWYLPDDHSWTNRAPAWPCPDLTFDHLE